MDALAPPLRSPPVSRDDRRTRTAAGGLIVTDVHKPAGHALKTEGQPVRFAVAPGDVRFIRAASPR